MKTVTLASIIFFCTLQGCMAQKINIIQPNKAPYNLTWGMSYDKARNTPLYSLEVSDVNYAGKDQNLIIAIVDPSEIHASDYNEVNLYFDKEKGLASIFVKATVDYGSAVNDQKIKDDGKEGLALYNKEVKELNKIYGLPVSKEEFVTDKNKFYESLSECIKMQNKQYSKGLESNNIPGCSKWQRDYKKGNITVLLTIGIHEITKQYSSK